MIKDKYRITTFLDKDQRTIYNADTNEIITYNDKNSTNFKISKISEIKKPAFEKELDLREAEELEMYSNYWTLISGSIKNPDNWQTALANIDANIKENLSKTNKKGGLLSWFRNLFPSKKFGETYSLNDFVESSEDEAIERKPVLAEVKPKIINDPNQYNLFEKPKNVETIKNQTITVPEETQKKIIDLLTYKILLDYDDFKNRKFLENKYYSIRKPFSLERDTSKLLVRGSLIDVIAMLMEKNMYFGSTIPQEAQMLKSKYNAKLTEIGPGVDIKNHVVWGSINTNEITNNSNQIKITEYSFKDKPVKSREYLLPLKSKSEFLKHVSVIDEMVDNNLSIIRDYTNLQNGYARQEIYLVRNKVEEPFKYKEKTPIQEVADILFT